MATQSNHAAETEHPTPAPGAYTSNVTLEEATALLRLADQRILLVTHAKPDGDAFGSVVALATALRAMGQAVEALFVGPVPASFATLPGNDLAGVYEQGAEIGAFDLVVMLDTGAWSQLATLRQPLEAHVDRMVIIDHHLNGDVPAKYKYIDGSAAACCEIVADMIDLLDQPFDDTIRDALFVGIASDTGWFKYSNAGAGTHELAARLKRLGVDHAALFAQLEQTERPHKLALKRLALDSLELVAGGKAAIMALRAADFAETGALLEETERFVNEPLVVGEVQVVALLTEPPGCESFWEENGDVPASDGHHCATRISLRSKPGAAAVNVAELAAQFGGGGHARAAGAKVNLSVDQALPQMRQALVDAIEKTGA